MRRDGLCQAVRASRQAPASAGLPDGSTATTSAAPKSWPMLGAVSRASSRRSTSKAGSTDRAVTAASVSMRNGVSRPALRTTVRFAPAAVLSTMGTSSS